MNEFRIRKRAEACMACSRPFADEETIVSAVFEQEDATFLRQDFCEACFSGAPEAFSSWRSKKPRSEPERRRLDFDLALDFLRRLLEQEGKERAGLAYLLSLLLARKRRVKIEERRGPGGADVLRVRLRGEEGEESEHEIAVPLLDAEERDRLQGELQELFGDDSGASSPPDSGV